MVKDFHHSAPRSLACRAAQSIISAVPSEWLIGKEKLKEAIWWNCTIRTKEQQFGLSVKIDEALLDPRALAGDKEVQDGVNVFLEAEPRVSSKAGQDCTLGTSLWDIFVLQGLSRRKTVVFIEPGVEKSAMSQNNPRETHSILWLME